MKILVDADACPGAVKEILFRAAQRTGIDTLLVANRPLHTPPGGRVRLLVVPSGFDVADARIVELVEPGDLVITADIPLANQVIARGARALNPRGELYTTQNIAEHLARRDFLESLRSSGVVTGGPAPLGAADVRSFANALDRLLATVRPG